MNFILGGITVHLISSTDFTENFSRVSNGRVRHRTLDGSLKLTQHWRKTAISISGSGHIPFGLSGLDYSQPLLLSFGSKRSISSVSNVIAIPSERRTDTGFEPVGVAIVDNQAIITPLVLVGDVSTLTTVPNTDIYMVMYYPELSVIAEDPDESFSAGFWRWSFSAEEV